MRDLNSYVHNGIDGKQGPPGPAGPPGTAKYVGPNWSVIDRNVEGNGDAYLRSGPAKPPSGIGSLGLRTGSDTDKTAFGNEADFFGDPVSALDKVSYSVFVTGEDLQKSEWNAPSVTFEINPRLNGTDGYSSLVFATNKAQANKWTSIDATDPDQGFWFLTGAAGAATHCTQNDPPCTLAHIQEQLPDAKIFTVAIAKGKDYAFSGAADALRINDTTYDFEPFGVSSN